MIAILLTRIMIISTGTVQENIVFNRPLNNARLSEVIYCCALLQDIEQLPQGLDTTVGERGVQLSGGQKARVRLRVDSEILY